MKIDLMTKIANGEPLSDLFGTRVVETSNGRTYTGTVTKVVYNTYLRIDVDGGGWIRSGSVIETI